MCWPTGGTHKMLIRVFIWILLAASLNACCGFYSLRSGRTDPNIKSISIHTIQNQSQNLVIPALTQKFTQQLRDKFQSNTSLVQIENNGDLDITGAIMSTSLVSVAANASQTAPLNQLTITVNMECKNRKNDKQSWSQSFSRFATFSSSQSLQNVQDQLITDIGNQLTEDIFNKALVDW